MLALLYGQLLLACRHKDAWQYLEQGFQAAANLLASDEYFLVMKRHETLRRLPLGGTRAEPQGLEAMLQEAEVIRRLQGSQSQRPEGTEGRHLDTLD